MTNNLSGTIPDTTYSIKAFEVDYHTLHLTEPAETCGQQMVIIRLVV